jgi:hypothetical protein
MAAKATGYLELNIAGFDQALKTAKNLMATFAAGFAGYKLGTVFKDGIKDAIDFGKSMNTASRSMGGLGAGNLLLVQKALERTGQGAEEAQGHIADFVKSGRSISSMFGGADNYAAALSKSSKEYGDQADVLNRSAAKLQTIWNSIEVVVSKSRTFFLAMTEQFILPLQLALDMLKSINVAEIGERFGKAISDAALTLYGVFTNGNIVEALRLGVALAFQEGVNYLVGGINYIAGSTFIGMLSNGFLSVSSQFTAAMLDGINIVIKVFSAGMQHAISVIQTSPEMNKFAATINTIADEITSQIGDDFNFDESYNKYLNAGKDDESESFDVIMERTKGPISQDYIESVRGSASSAVGGLFPQGDGGGFQKADIFDTSKDQARLQEIIANGFKVGTEAAGKAQIDNTSAVTKGTITSFSGASSKVIADSLAKVGGGGNFLRVGMTLSERTALDQLRAQRESNEIQKVIAKNTAAEKKPVTMK